MTITPLGDCAVVLSLEANLDESVVARVRTMADTIERDPPVGVTEVVPAFAIVTVFYDPTQVASFESLCATLEARISNLEREIWPSEDLPKDVSLTDPDARARSHSHSHFTPHDRLEGGSGSESSHTAREVEIPVCYGGEFGPDLGDVASRHGLTPEQAVALHSSAHYFVQAIGFAPGFAYLGGLPERLHTPRRTTPRTQVPAGAVGIGSALTGVYPLVTPGGWNLIGRTPLKMFDPSRVEPALLRAGDHVRFRAVTAEEFAAWT